MTNVPVFYFACNLLHPPVAGDEHVFVAMFLGVIVHVAAEAERLILSLQPRELPRSKQDVKLVRNLMFSGIIKGVTY